MNSRIIKCVNLDKKNVITLNSSSNQSHEFENLSLIDKCKLNYSGGH